MLVSRPILPGLRDTRRVEVKSSPHGDQQGSMRMRKLLMAGVALGFGLAMTAPAATKCQLRSNEARGRLANRERGMVLNGDFGVGR